MYTVLAKQNYLLKGAIRRIPRQNKHLCLANITAVEDSLYGRIRRNLSHGCRYDCGTRRVREGRNGGCCLCWSSIFLQSVEQNIRAVLQLAGRRTLVIACQALLIGMARNALDAPGWNARVRPHRDCCCSNTRGWYTSSTG